MPLLPDDLQTFAPCPKCGSSNAERITFTPWGMTFGPRLLNHVKCKQCETTYNGKTGKSNGVAILLYILIEIGIIIGLGFLLKIAFN